MALLLIFLLLSASTLPAMAETNTEKGWKALVSNDDRGAIEAFKLAVEEDESDIRAQLGLSYAYGLSLDDKRSWEAFRAALDNSDIPHSLLYASVSARRFFNQESISSSGIEETLLDVADDPDPSGIFQAMAFERLGALEEGRGNLEKARDWYSKIGAIMDWRLIGPYHNVSASGHERVFDPELEDNPDSTYVGASGGDIWWTTPSRHRLDRWIDFSRYFPTVYGVFYAVTYVKSDEAKRVQLRLGTSGAFKLFLNQELIDGTIDENNNDLDTYITEVGLKKGWNRVLVKCDNSELTRCNFLLRITDQAGQSVDGLEYSSEYHQTLKGNSDPEKVANPHLLALQSAKAANPGHLENAWLLAEAHLRNDQVNEAELVLRDALEIEPNCIVTLTIAIDLYLRGERTDEVVSTTEKILALNPDLPVSLVYAYQRAIQAEKLDEAEEIVKSVEKILPSTTDYYHLAVDIARKRSRLNEVNELQEEAFRIFPGNYTFATAATIRKLRTTGSHDSALAVIEKHLKANYSESGLLMKAAILSEVGRYDEWEKVWTSIFDLAPASAGYHGRRAGVFTKRNMYDKALESILEALRDAPTVSGLWFTAGTYYKNLDQEDKARESYKLAIRTNPAHFDAREALRELDGVPSPFSLMKGTNIDSLIENSPSQSDFPEADAIFVFDDTRRVVYDGSRCEVEYEQLIKILSKNGIDNYKEFSLPGGGNSSLIVEKAVVLKQDGTEIPADRSGSYAVFKGLEPGDYMYIKTKLQEYSLGTLSPYFLDEVSFNGYEPVLHSRYQLLTPSGEEFNWRVSNAVIPMITEELEDRDLYTWEIKNAPAMVYEDGMPSYDAIGASLQISSIPKWSEVIKWYYEIAKTKSRTSMKVRNVMEELFPSGKKFTDKEIVEGVYRYITSEIRYSAVNFRQSGIIPQKARDVLSTRIGDCKDVATLCIAMLAERDIEAYHVLVDTDTYGVTRDLLPSISFDHDIVMVDMNGTPLYLDLTADDVPVGSVPFADMDANCLVIYPSWQFSQKINRRLFLPNNVTINTTITLKDDLSASISQHCIHTGARTQFYRSAWKEATQKERERSLVEDLSTDYPYVSLDGMTVKYLDTLIPVVEYTIDYGVPDFTMEVEDLFILRVPWYDPYEPNSALSYEERTYPYQSRNYIDTLTENVTIVMPEGYDAVGLEESLAHTNINSNVTRESSTNGNVLKLKRVAINKGEVVLPQDYNDFRKYYNDVLRADRQALLLAPKGTKFTKPRKRETGQSRN